MAKHVTTVIRDQTALITVSRIEAHNALNAQVLAELLSAIEAARQDSRVRVLSLTGAGGKAFIAGADILEFLGASPADALGIAVRIRKVTDALVACEKPVLAVIDGHCLGGGFELALACDLRLCSTRATFGLPEIKLGILPGGGGTVRLTKVAGSSVARMLAMTGDPIPAPRAYELGLVAAVHEPEALPEAAQKLAVRLAALPPFALAQLKSVLNLAVDTPTDAACDAEVKAFALCYATADQNEGARAFLEKRKPVFTGK